jgi:hypothetical protein
MFPNPALFRIELAKQPADMANRIVCAEPGASGRQNSPTKLSAPHISTLATSQ